MEKLYKIGGNLSPKQSFIGVNIKTEYNGIRIEVTNDIVELECKTEAQFISAEEIMRNFFLSWAFKTNKHIKNIEWNMRSKPNNIGGSEIHISFNEKINLTDSCSATVTRSINGIATIISDFDNGDFSEISSLSAKCEKNIVLQRVFEYYNQEVLDNAMPLIGIYKAIELIGDELGNGEGKDAGYRKLANLVGKERVYVTRLQSSTQFQRHAVTDGKKFLDENSVKNRAKELILAFANSLP